MPLLQRARRFCPSRRNDRNSGKDLLKSITHCTTLRTRGTQTAPRCTGVVPSIEGVTTNEHLSGSLFATLARNGDVRSCLLQCAEMDAVTGERDVARGVFGILTDPKHWHFVRYCKPRSPRGRSSRRESI